MRNLFDGIDVAADLDLEVVQVGTETWLEKEIENFTALRLRIIEQQARHNLESTERQYNLRQKALELGWPDSRIQIDRIVVFTNLHCGEAVAQNSTTGLLQDKSVVCPC